MNAGPGWMAGVSMLVVGAASARGEIVIVHVFDFEFSINAPGGAIVDATIAPGDTIRFLFDDPGHTATSVAGIPEVFNFAGNVGQSFDHVFTNLGIWHYYCLPHGNDNGNGTASGMAGTITVVPAPAALLPMALAGLAARRRRS